MSFDKWTLWRRQSWLTCVRCKSVIGAGEAKYMLGLLGRMEVYCESRARGALSKFWLAFAVMTRMLCVMLTIEDTRWWPRHHQTQGLQTYESNQ